MRAVKAVQIPYEPSDAVLALLESFKGMVNHCLRIGLAKGITSRFRLSSEVYHELAKTYGLHTWYALSAIEVATSILRNYRKAKKRNPNVKEPKARKLMAKLGNQGYKVVGDRLRMPIKPREYFYVPLHKRVLAFLSDASLKLGSMTLTARTISVAFSKTAGVIEPKGYVAFDLNEKSVDGVTSDCEVMRYDLSQIYCINSNLFNRIRKFQHRKANDRRVQKMVISKWFRARNDKVNSVLHRVSKEIVDGAKAGGYGIIL